MPIAEVDVIGFLGQHVAFGREVGFGIADAGFAVQRFDHVPVLADGDQVRAGEVLEVRGAAGAIEMAVIDDDVFDVAQIDADFLDDVAGRRRLPAWCRT
jgi:hypothetical protein